MVATLSILIAIASALGVYKFFFDGTQDLIEQTTVFFVGGQRDFRLFILLSVPAVVGLLAFVLLQRAFGLPVHIPVL
jgi:hypothetical protein